MSNGAARRLWLVLWFGATGLLMLLCVATLADRPFAPEALRHFPQQVLEQGRRFSREVRVVSTIQALSSLSFMLWLCFSRRGARLLDGLEALGRGRPWREVAVVAAGLVLAHALMELPFAYYLGFVHEHAYGLAKETAAGWARDFAMSAMLDLAMSLALWIPLYWLIRRSPRGWWLPGTALTVGLTGILTLLYPVLIMPLFSTMEPVGDPEVHAMVRRLADRAGVRVETVRILRASEETSRVNAMVTGLGPTKQVILYDTLIQQFDPAEVEVVIAHELAHAIHADVVTSWLLSGAGAAVTLWLASRMLIGMVGAGPLRLNTPFEARGLALIMLFFSLTGQIAAPIENGFSRTMEVRADHFALDLTRNPQAFISGFARLARGNPGDVDPSPLVEFLAHSHPSVMHRIRAASRWAE